MWLASSVQAQRDTRMQPETEGQPQRGRPKCALSQLSTDMMAFLRDLLKDGPMTSNEVRQRVVERFGESALQNLKRTRTRIGVKRRRKGFGKGGYWEMQLPPAPKGTCSR